MAIDDFDTSHNRECHECHRFGFDDGDWQFVGYDDEAELYICPDCQSIHQYVNDDLLVRDAQQRIGADDAGHTCPRCEGSGKYERLGFEATECALCNGSGQV